MNIHSKRTPHGFDFGAAVIEALHSDEKTGVVVVSVRTIKHPEGVQVRVTKTGLIRVFQKGTEWKPR